MAAEVVGVVGAGTMGAGIAQVAAAAGHKVLLSDARDGRSRVARDEILARLERREKRGDAEPGTAQLAASMIKVADGPASMREADAVIEAVAEDASAKRAVYAELEKHVRDDTLLATNTSSIPLEQLAASLRLPGRFAGMHFFNPAPLMRLVEVVSAKRTGRDVAGRLTALARSWGKVTVQAKSAPGFIVNRISRPYYAEPLLLLEQGCASVAVIDACLASAGFPMGPFRLMDLIGIDVNCAVTASIHAGLGDRARFGLSSLQRQMVERGKLGRKSGSGFYDYCNGGKPPPAAGRPRPRIGALPGGPRKFFGAGLPVFELEGLAVAAAFGDESDRRAKYLARLDYVPDWRTATDVAVGFDENCPRDIKGKADGWFAEDGITLHELAISPGLIVARTVAALVNMAFDAAEEGLATREDIDLGLVCGLNHPRGPFGWAGLLGSRNVVGTLRQLLPGKGGAAHYQPCDLLARENGRQGARVTGPS